VPRARLTVADYRAAPDGTARLDHGGCELSPVKGSRPGGRPPRTTARVARARRLLTGSRAHVHPRVRNTPGAPRPMTYQIALTAPSFVQHVSDRLVTVGLREHDPAANKTVVFCGRDGYLVLGYTGLAYLGARRLSTDHFVAESLLGDEIPDKPQGAFFGGPVAPVPTLGYAFQRLRADLDRALSHVDLREHESAFEILAVGWSVRRNRKPHAFEWKLKRAGREPLTWTRHWTTEPFSICDAPTRLTSAATTRLRHALGPIDSNAGSTVLVLAEAIRQAADNSAAAGYPLIGTDCMSVTLGTPASTDPAIVCSVGDPRTVGYGSSSYSPWVISSGRAIPPWLITAAAPGETPSPVADFPFGPRQRLSIWGHHGGDMHMGVQPRIPDPRQP
jgi:hypothetical protein